jgi:hypothetical protein
MAMSWASKRKLVFASIAIGVVFLVVGIPTFLLFYKAPTCFDLKQNGGELGIDCGGKCSRLCQSAFLPPRIAWGDAKIEKIANGYYNASSYIINPNINGGAVDVPYKISLYDAEGVFIVERLGNITLYPHRNSLAFQTAINTEKRIPSKASFEFIKSPEWFKSSDELGSISILDKRYNEDENGSSLEVVLKNNSLTPYRDILISAILSDSNGNVIGFSQTKIDSLEARGQQAAPFTWPVNRNGKVATIEIIPIIRPILNN